MRSHSDREQGQTLAEYAVVLAVITVIVLAAFSSLSAAITALLMRVVGLPL
jgi:Flp pilus assembly pilin Flp